MLLWFGSILSLLLVKFALMSWDSRAGLAFYVGFTQTLQRKKKEINYTVPLIPLAWGFLSFDIYLYTANSGAKLCVSELPRDGSTLEFFRAL